MLVMEAPAKRMRGNEMFGAAMIGQPKLLVFLDPAQISLDVKLRFWHG